MNNCHALLNSNLLEKEKKPPHATPVLHNFEMKKYLQYDNMRLIQFLASEQFSEKILKKMNIICNDKGSCYHKG